MTSSTRKSRRAAQTGFTLIELIVVIVIIGILSAVAIPKFADLTASAQTSTNKAIAAQLGAAASIAFANKKLNPASSVPSTCAGVNDAAYMDQVIPTGTGGYTFGGTFPACTVQDTAQKGTAASFVVPQ